MIARVLVTGAEGLVGSAVVARLLDAGHPVTTLSLPGAQPHEGVRVVRGDAREAAAIATAVEGVDAVVHLAAIADPLHPSPSELFANNTVATFAVLWTAAEHGVRRFVTAGSANATGLRLNPHRPRPASYPVDERTPTDVADPYSLSKQVDELTLRAVCRRFGASGVALRLPLMVSPSNVDNLRRWTAEHLEDGVGDGWAWLDVRDGAEAVRLAVVGEYTGAHVLTLAAEVTFADEPTEELLRRYAPDVPRSATYPGRTAPVDTSRARALLGFQPKETSEDHIG